MLNQFKQIIFLRALAVLFFLSLGWLVGIVPAQAASAIPFSIALSEVVTVTGTPRLALDVGGVTRYATYASGSGTSTLTFTYTTQAGDVDLDGVTVASPIDLNGGTITDQAGNALSVLTFTPPNTSGIKVNHPALSMDFANGDYILNGTHYASLPSFLTAAGGSFTRASIGTYFDSSGTLQTATSGTPRFDYDPVTHVAKGILIEEARTNLLLRSEDFSTSWFPFNATRTANTTDVTDLRGTNTAVKVVYTGSSAQLYQSVTVTEGVSYTGSIWIRGTGTVRFELMEAGGSYVAYANSGLVTLTNTWTRVSITGTKAVDGFPLGFYLFPSSGTTLYAWGGQLEQAGFVTSYIPTTTAAVTRAADILSVSSTGWFNATAGTFAAQFDLSAFSPNRQYVFCPPSGDIGFDRLNIRGADVSGAVPPSGVVGNGSNAVSTLSVAGAGVVNGTEKVVLNYSATASAFSRNGSAIQTGGNYSGSARASFQIGSNGSSLYQLAGHIALFRYYPLSAANSQLPLLTQ